MADEHLRELERVAGNGDSLAQQRLAHARCRAGQCCAHKTESGPRAERRARDWWTIEAPGSPGAPNNRWPMPWYCRWTRKEAVEAFVRDHGPYLNENVPAAWKEAREQGFRAVKVQAFRVEGGTIHISE